ncbi:MAG TPA: hypothetical protein VF062_19475 [Candidatus Limnocylindrales bacterium]
MITAAAQVAAATNVDVTSQDALVSIVGLAIFAAFVIWMIGKAFE